MALASGLERTESKAYRVRCGITIMMKNGTFAKVYQNVNRVKKGVLA